MPLPPLVSHPAPLLVDAGGSQCRSPASEGSPDPTVMDLGARWVSVDALEVRVVVANAGGEGDVLVDLEVRTEDLVLNRHRDTIYMKADERRRYTAEIECDADVRIVEASVEPV